MFTIIASAFDLLIGDPKFLHPVSFIGKAAEIFENLSRKIFSNPFFSGLTTVAAVLLATGSISFFLLYSIYIFNETAGLLLSSLLFSFSFAVRSLVEHTSEVKIKLLSGDTGAARHAASKIVGRDTENISEEEIIRAAVETAAESLTDGIIAPIFYGTAGCIAGGPLLGAVFAILYRAVNTMDSMFGHKNKKYHRFGWTAARLDDLANFIPARISFPLILLSAWFRKERVKNCITVFMRDRNNHPSPNAGQTESAFAGALGVKLGGLNYYAGVKEFRSNIGDEFEAFNPGHIDRSNAIIILTAIQAVILSALILFFSGK